MKLITLFLTCAHQQEAETIARDLLSKKLVACVKQTPVNSMFTWQHKIDSATEILLIMDSIEDKFSAIEQVVKKLHSYETFVLIAHPITHASAGVEAWIKSSLKE